MKKKILIVLADGFEDIEAITAIDVLTRAGVDVTIAGIKDGPVKAAYGTTIIPTTTIDEAGDDYDGIVLPGGKKNAESLATNSKLIDLVRKFDREKKIVAAICASPSHVLSEAAGILKGRPATGDPVFNKKLAGGGAVLTDQAVTVDGHIITGMGPGAAMEFALALAEYLVGPEAADSLKDKWRIKKKFFSI